MDPDAPPIVVSEGAVRYAGAAGFASLAHRIPIDSNTVFQAGSLAKQITGFTVLLLVEEGRVRLDDDIRRYLPGFPGYGAAITIRQLLHHTSGLRDEWDLLTLAGWRAGDPVTAADGWNLVTRQQTLNFPPGTSFLYSNSGYDLLARIAASVPGSGFATLGQNRILGPLGMRDSRMESDHAAIILRAATGHYPAMKAGGRRPIPAEPAELRFRSGPGREIRMQLVVGGQDAGEFRRMEPFDLPAGGLAVYGGAYSSEELDVTYRIAVRDSALVIRGPRGLEWAATPSYQDGFVVSPINAILKFTRGAGGAITGFSISTDRVRNLAFQRHGNPR